MPSVTPARHPTDNDPAVDAPARFSQDRPGGRWILGAKAGEFGLIQ